jgi:hypothetical protein
MRFLTRLVDRLGNHAPWQWVAGLPSAERIALLAAVGTIVAALIGGMCSLLTVLSPILFRGEPPHSAQVLRLAVAELEDEKTSPVFAAVTGQIPVGSLGSNNAWNELSRSGFHLFYYAIDASTLGPLVPIQIPASTISTQKPYPTVPIYLELWNIDKDQPTVIDEISLRLTRFEPPPTGSTELYLAFPPGGLGGNGGLTSMLPEKVFTLSLSSLNRNINLLQSDNDRLVIEPEFGQPIRAEIDFVTPGRYYIEPSIRYHLPDGTSNVVSSTEVVFSWATVDFVDGTRITFLH